jgi:hypothetical protein
MTSYPDADEEVVTGFYKLTKETEACQCIPLHYAALIAPVAPVSDLQSSRAYESAIPA